MALPFTAAQFLEAFGRYNEAVWPMPWVWAAGAVACVAAAVVDGRLGSRAIAAYLALVWAWMAVGYHATFFTPINPAAWGFAAVFLVASILFAWQGIVREKLVFDLPRSSAQRWGGAVLMVWGVTVYPVTSLIAGHAYPLMPTFGVPCPTTIFTLGMLLWTRERTWSVMVVPLAWSAFGASAAVMLGMWEDVALLAAGVSVLVITLTPALSRRERESNATLTPALSQGRGRKARASWS